jgi:pimeloyl-ACP methyl ester carboxylesterase
MLSGTHIEISIIHLNLNMTEERFIKLTRRAFGLGLLTVPVSTGISGCGDRNMGMSQQINRELPARPSHFALVDGAKIYADIQGQGPDVVLIHGASGNGRDFTFSFATQLAERGFRVLSFDRPGLGWSDPVVGGVSPIVQARYLRQAATQLSVHNPIVLGHSYGGSVAMAWALQDQHDLKGLVSLAGATNVWPGDLDVWYRLTGSSFGRLIIAPVVTKIARDRDIISATESVFEPNKVPDGYIDHLGIGLTLRASSFALNAQQVTDLKSYLEKMEGEYGNIATPTSIIFGDLDTTVPANVHGTKLHRQLRNSKLTVLRGVGHMPHHVEAEFVISEIERLAVR